MLENRRRLSTGPEELAWQLPGAWAWRCRNLRTAGRAATRQERAGSSRYRSRHRGPLCVEQARSTGELEVQRPMAQQSESRHRSERTRRSLLENIACASRGSIVVARAFGLARSFANLISQDATYFLTYARSTAALRRALRVRTARTGMVRLLS